MKSLQTWLVNIHIFYIHNLDHNLFQEEDAVGLRTRAFARMGAERANISEVNAVISKDGRRSQF